MHKLDIAQNKIISIETLQNKVNIWKFLERKIVFTNGCFDLLHTGHLHIINESAQLGNLLIIGLNTDQSVRNLKGNSRPIQDEKTRAIILASLMHVSGVVLFNEETPLNLIKIIRPDIITKGGDYNKDKIVGADFVKSYGGKIKIIDYLSGNSTSIIESKIKNTSKC